MKPLHVVAHLLETVSLRAPLHLDALLVWSVSIEQQRPSPISGDPIPFIEIPLAREPGGRFWLCSQGFCRVERSEIRHKNWRAPWHEYARLGDGKAKRFDITSGVNKGVRVPYEVQLLEGNTIEWWCVGDPDEIRRLLSRVRYLGRFRGSGKGKLDFYRGDPWGIEECEAWDGFPIMRDGKPLRALPTDYPGLVEPQTGFAAIDPPYWDRSKVQLCAVPEVA